MSESQRDLISTGIYRLGMWITLAGFAAMYANAEGLSPSAKGWDVVLIGAVIGVHGAIEPLATYGMVRFRNWRNESKVANHD